MKIRKALSCSLCLEIFDDPKTLPCMHSFCASCLHECICKGKSKGKSGPTFRCPLCRADTFPIDRSKPREQWAGDFKSNHLIVSLLDACHSVISQKTKSVQVCQNELIPLDTKSTQTNKEIMSQSNPKSAKIRTVRTSDKDYASKSKRNPKTFQSFYKEENYGNPNVSAPITYMDNQSLAGKWQYNADNTENCSCISCLLGSQCMKE